MHPKVDEKDCIECDPILEFENYIPEIQNELGLNTQNIQLRWYSKNCIDKDNQSLNFLQLTNFQTQLLKHIFYIHNT